MLFVSSSPNYRVYIRSEVEPLRNQEGQLVKPGKPALRAQFWPGGATPPWMVERVEKELSFRGLAEEQTPLQRISFYESAAIADEDDRKLVEEKLLASCGDGTVIMVEKPLASLPYPKYLTHRKVQGRRTIEHVVDEIRAAVDTTGVDPAAVAAYEGDHADQHSERIVAAMQELAETIGEDQVVTA